MNRREAEAREMIESYLITLKSINQKLRLLIYVIVLIAIIVFLWYADIYLYSFEYEPIPKQTEPLTPQI